MAQTTLRHVFMSYSRIDEEVMRRITTFLRNQGIKVWVDNENLVPGTPIWEEEIENAINGAFAIVVVLSPDAKGSEWVRREITYADQYEKRVFPVLVNSDEDSSIPIRLITRQFVDIRSNEEVGLNSLSAAIAFYAEGIEARERKARAEAEKLARVQAEREAAERESARLRAELEAAELAMREAAEKAAREKAQEEAVREKAAHEKAAREKAEREKAEREVIKKSAHEAKEKENRARAEKRRQKYLELRNKTIGAIMLYYRRMLLIAIAVTLIVLTGIFAPSLLASPSTSIPLPTATSLLGSLLSSPPGPTKTRMPTVSTPDETLQRSAVWSNSKSCQQAASGILDINSPWLSNDIILDGKISTAQEWLDAVCLDLAMDPSRTGTATLSTRWWFKNDGRWLYLLARVPAASLGDIAYISYFWPYPYVTHWEHSDTGSIDLNRNIFDGYGWNEVNWSDDILASPPGKTDVYGRTSSDATYRWFEFRKALNSGDDYDWDWASGQSFGTGLNGDLLIGIYASTTQAYFETYIRLLLGTP
jgi:hypothetical protein